jgi:hypothetical protein
MRKIEKNMQGIVINGISKCKDWKIWMKNMHSIF